MSPRSVWRPLLDELAAWRDAGRVARFWLRDDDAIEPTARLDTLLDVTSRYRIPVALAVIPAHTGDALADRLGREDHVTVVVHGRSHDNHAPAGEKKQELGAHRPADVVLADLSDGLAKLRRLHGERLAPVLVPPWNRIDSALIASLSGLGFEALSTFGPPRPASLPIVNSTVDIMDWHGTRGCQDHADIVADIVTGLESARQNGMQQPVGLLTHHLVHDESAWEFLDCLFATTAGSVEWLPVRALYASG